jgi:hypothetical protein
VKPKGKKKQQKAKGIKEKLEVTNRYEKGDYFAMATSTVRTLADRTGEITQHLT